MAYNHSESCGLCHTSGPCVHNLPDIKKLRPELYNNWLKRQQEENMSDPRKEIINSQEDEIEEEEVELDEDGEIVEEVDEPIQHIKLVPYERTTPKIGRNVRCPCGSGVKYKYCCLR